MKLLTDFDGVWTYPDEEGVAHGAALDAALESALGEEERPAVRGWIAHAREALRAEPLRWGWSVAGRISAFADEDPFTEHGALLHYLEAASRAHVGGVRDVEARRGPGITASAADAGRELLQGGVEVVVVSNSGTEKLKRWFDHAGLANRIHPEQAAGALRLRGSARKFVLAPGGPDAIDGGGVIVDVARPHYEAVLREERPDAVVGDVFSLDLALPLALKRREPAWRHVRLFWLAHGYAPERMRQAVASLPAGEVEIVERGLPGVADRLLGKA